MYYHFHWLCHVGRAGSISFLASLFHWKWPSSPYHPTEQWDSDGFAHCVTVYTYYPHLKHKQACAKLRKRKSIAVSLYLALVLYFTSPERYYRGRLGPKQKTKQANLTFCMYKNSIFGLCFPFWAPMGQIVSFGSKANSYRLRAVLNSTRRLVSLPSNVRDCCCNCGCSSSSHSTFKANARWCYTQVRECAHYPNLTVLCGPKQADTWQEQQQHSKHTSALQPSSQWLQSPSHNCT